MSDLADTLKVDTKTGGATVAEQGKIQPEWLTDRAGTPFNWSAADLRLIREAARTNSSSWFMTTLPRLLLPLGLPPAVGEPFALGEQDRALLARLVGALSNPLVAAQPRLLQFDRLAGSALWALRLRGTPTRVLSVLASSRHMAVRRAVAALADMPEPVAAVLSGERNPEVRRVFLANPTAPEEHRAMAALMQMSTVRYN
jgi:hypothetical protein